MIDRRKLSRQQLIYNFKIINRKTGELMGHLLDITAKGVKLVSDAPVDIGKVFHLKIVLDTELIAKEDIHIDVISLRCEKGDTPYSYDAGFEILDSSPLQGIQIQEVIDILGMM